MASLSSRSEINETLRRRFETAWASGAPLPIEACLPDEHADEYLHTLEELVLIELEFAWKAFRRGAAARPAPVESYLWRFPPLAEAERALRLVRQEFALRQRLGDGPKASEYQSRFPGLVRTESDLAGDDDPSPPLSASHAPATPPKAHDTTLPLGDVTAPADPAPATDIPLSIGRYAVQSVLGEGGFGRVYLGYDPDLRRKVAIKTPRAERLRLTEDAQAYLDEARNVARLDHPNIVPVYDMGRTPDGMCYVVSKWIDGERLDAWRERASPGLEEILALAATVAEALHHAHRQGLVHRDIKPGNILVDARGNPHVVDFGLALREEDHGLGPEFAGTPAYMSAEQALSQSHLVDARSDIFSLGVVLYELLTGRRPFAGATIEELKRAIARGEPRPPRQIDDGIPREVDRICLKALARRPADRYSTAIDLADDLRSALAATGSTQVELRSAAPDDSLPGRALDFSAERERLRRGFVGRAWLTQEVETWADSAAERAFLLVGDPGSGKSSFLAMLIDHEPRVAAHHFCVASLAESLDPRRAVESLAAQLCSHNDAVAEAVSGASVGEPAEDDPGAMLRRLIADPLRAAKAREPLWIVIDGLDESLAAGERSIARLVKERMNDLPSHVRLILSARNLPEICDMFSRCRIFELRADQSENDDDLAQYLQARLQEPALLDRLAEARVDRGDVAALVRGKAAGNFLYASHTLDALASGALDPRRPESFPEGLVGIYHDFFTQLFATRAEYARYRPLLDVLCAARQPLSADEIAHYLGREPFEVEESLETLAAFFPERDGRYRAFHKSIIDWLCGAAGRSRAFRADVKSGHRRIAERLLERFQAGARGAAIVQYLPAHLTACDRQEELAALLMDVSFLEAKAESGLIFDLVRDLGDAVRALPDDHPRRRILELIDEALRTDIHFLSHYPSALFQSLWNRCWWYDCRQAADYYDPPPGGWPASGPPWSRGEEKLCDWLAAARRQRDGRPWIRSLRPPRIHLGTAQQAVLRGHRDQVWTADVSPDGRLIASAGRDRTVRLWDAATGAEKAYSRLESTAPCVAFSPDGRSLAVGLSSGRVSLYRSSDLSPLASLDHGAAVRALAFFPEGGRLAVAADDGAVFLWRPEDGRRWECGHGHTHAATAVAVSPDGQRIASGGLDGYIRIWQGESGAPVKQIRRVHKRFVAALAYSPDGELLFSAGKGNPGPLRVWETERYGEVATLAGHEDMATAVAFSPAGRMAASGSRDHTVRLWDAARSVELGCLRGHGNAVSAVAFSRDGERLISASWDQTVRIWSPARGAELASIRAHQERIEQLVFSPDGAWLASAAGFERSEIFLWSAHDGVLRKRLEGHEKGVTRLKWLPGGALLSASFDGTLRLWDRESGLATTVLNGHSGGINDVAISSDARLAASASGDATAILWRLDDGSQIARLAGHIGSVWSVAIAGDGTLVATGGRDGAVRLWTARGEPLSLLAEGLPSVSSLAFSPSGAVLAVGDRHGETRLVDVPHGGELLCLSPGDREAFTVASLHFSEDGRRLAASHEERGVRLWETATGRLIDEYQGVADGAALAAGAEQFPWRAIRRARGAAGLAIESSATGEPLAWLPSLIWRITTHPGGRIWAGAAGRYLYLFALET